MCIRDRGIATANAQENVTVETTNGSEQPTLTKEVYPQKEAEDVYKRQVLETPRQTETLGGKSQRVSGRLAAGNTPPHRAGDVRRLRGA